MQQHLLTITQVARLYGFARTTPFRAIKRGVLSSTIRGDGIHVIALSECIRVWGEPTNIPIEMQQNAAVADEETQHGAAAEIFAAMLEEMKAMRAAIERLEERQKLLTGPGRDSGGSEKNSESTSDTSRHAFVAEMAALRKRQYEEE